MKLLMDGKFILHEYNGSFQGKPVTGINIIGYNLDLKKFQVAWIDSFHTGTSIMFSEGNKGEKHLDVIGNYAYVTPDEEQYWRWRTSIDILSDTEVIIASYNISPDGQETKATETVYTKV